jgi:NhaP-type Na+/H+ or K+/H+ antiporter
MNKYFCANVSTKSRTTIKYFMKMTANTAEGVLFLFLGIEAVSKNYEWNTAFILLTIFFCLIFRAISRSLINSPVC